MAHKHKNAHATGNAIQRNGNINGKIADAKIMERGEADVGGKKSEEKESEEEAKGDRSNEENSD